MMGWNKLWQSVATGIIGAIVLAGFSLSVWADENQKMVVVTGVAVLQGENIAGARQTAVQDALRQAVEQGVGMLMNATSILKNDELMEKIYTNTQGYITRYEIIKERKEQNGLYRVKIQAGVKTGALRDTLVKLGIIKAMMDYPRIMIIPYPQEVISPVVQTAETVLIKHLTGKRFDVVDPTKSRQLHGEAKELFKVDTLENVAARIGLQHHAEIVILYGLKAGAGEFDGIMENAPVSLRTQAVVTTTAQILTAEEQTVTGVGKTADLARLDGAGRAGLPYVITLHAQPRADRLVITFQQELEAIPGVVSLTERSSGGGITEMMVKYKGNSALFKREILSALYTRDGFDKLHTVASKGRFMVFSVR
jgi:hypothetical protein